MCVFEPWPMANMWGHVWIQQVAILDAQNRAGERYAAYTLVCLKIGHP